jgi:hypothetical protein
MAGDDPEVKIGTGTIFKNENSTCPYFPGSLSRAGSIMRSLIRTIFLSLCVVLAGNGFVRAQAGQNPPAGAEAVFIDRDNDGVNDRFRDLDGDGVNDMTGTPYDHRFEFADKDGDHMNDLWRDADGDGVNDYCRKREPIAGDDIDANVLDFDRDGVNDVTGFRYRRGEGYSGYRFGFVDERSGSADGALLDEDGNGIDDRLERMRMGEWGHDRDFFIDEDGDGICDGRGDRLRRGEGRGGGHHGGEH